MTKDNQLENFEFEENKIYTGTFYKLGGRHYGGKILCDDGTEFVVAQNKDIVNGSIVEFRVVDGVVSIDNVVALKQQKITGALVKTASGDIKFIEKGLKGFQKQYSISNSKNSELIRGAFGRVVGAHIIEDGTVTIDKVYGVIGSLRDEVEAVVDKVNMSQNWTEESLKELAAIPESVDLSTVNLVDEKGQNLNAETYDPSKPNYVDLRDKFFCTIDPDDCQDMDDSVYTEIDENGNYVIYTAIADVTEYINPVKTPHINQQAEERGMSLYYMYGAQDMLPHKIASGICSLNEGQDRLTMCVKTVVDAKTGKRISKKVFHAVINSKKKLSYQEAQKFIDVDEKLIDEIYNNSVNIAKTSKSNFVPDNLESALITNWKASQALKKEREKRDSLTFESKKEPKMILSEDGKEIKEVKVPEYLPSMGLIEALMVNANEAVAEILNSIAKEAMYRVHGKPNEYKIDKLNAIFEHFGVKGTWDGTKSKLKSIMNKLHGNEFEDLISANVITCLDRAKYSVYPHPFDTKTGEVLKSEICHSALDSEFYTHFTSGIRRYPDLVAQYMLKIYEREGRIVYDDKYLKKVAAHVSSRESELDNAEKEIKDLGFAAYVENHVNENVEGIVCEIDGDKGHVIVLTEQNMRIHIPISDFFRSGKNPDKYVIDQYGIAIYKDNEEVVSLGEKVVCKISGSSRILREVYGTTDLTKTFERPKHVENADYAYRIVEKEVNAKLDNEIKKVLREGNKKLERNKNRWNSKGKK